MLTESRSAMRGDAECGGARSEVAGRVMNNLSHGRSQCACKAWRETKAGRSRRERPARARARHRNPNELTLSGYASRKGRLTKWPGPTKWPRRISPPTCARVGSRSVARTPYVRRTKLATCAAPTKYVRCTKSYVRQFVRRTNSLYVFVRRTSLGRARWSPGLSMKGRIR